MWARAMLTCAMLALLSGCATMQLETPRLQVIDVGLLGGDLLQQQLRLRMRVQNPNDVALQVRGISYEVQLAGETFADGESERDFVIPALGETEFNVDVTANAAAAVLRLLGSRDRGNPQYRVLGKVKLAKGLIRTIPFDHSGELKLR
jgi:LEA14-like dessication related protein